MKRLTILLTMAVASTASAQTVTPFQAFLDQSGVTRGGIQGTPSTATATATFELTEVAGDPAATTMSYSIQFNGIDLDGTQTADILDDITALHLHDTTECLAPGCLPGDTALTQHVLNIFGFPRTDDADILVDAANGVITGLWDDSDENLTPPAVSRKISDPDVLQLLRNGQVALIAHTNQVDSGAIGGFVTQVPEPGALALIALGVLGLWHTRRRLSG